MPRARLRGAIFLASLALPGAVFAAGEAGKSGFNFLKMGAGPRAEAMGEAHTSVADDAYGAYWNPGGLVQLRHPEFALAYNQHLDGVNQQYLSYVHPLLGGRVLAANVTRLAVSSFDGYDNNGARNGSVSSDDTAVGVAAAQALPLAGPASPVLGLGAGARWVRERLADISATTVMGDAGLWSGGWDSWLGSWAKGVRLGFALRNLGARPRFVSKATYLPTTWAFGASVDRKLWGDPAILAAEVARTNSETVSGSIGAEYWAHRVLGVRLGFHNSDEEGVGVRFGLGVRLGAVQVDYSFANLGALGNSHRAGVTFRFGARALEARRGAAELVGSARELLRQDRAYEAIQELEEALGDDPGNGEALALLKEARIQLERLQENGDAEQRKRTQKTLEEEERKRKKEEGQ